MWMLKLFLFTSFDSKKGIFNSSQKQSPEGCSSGWTYILLLSKNGKINISYWNVQARDHFISNGNDPVAEGGTTALTLGA